MQIGTSLALGSYSSKEMQIGNRLAFTRYKLQVGDTRIRVQIH
jgi:hypothetical protein